MDRLLGLFDAQVIGLGEQLVERALYGICREAGRELGRHIGVLDAHRLAVGGADAEDVGHRIARAEGQSRADLGAGGDFFDPGGERAGDEAAGPHVLGERGEFDRLGDARLGDEGTGTLGAVDPALIAELVEGAAHGEAGDAEGFGQVALGGQLFVRTELALDQAEQVGAKLGALASRASRGGAVGHESGSFDWAHTTTADAFGQASGILQLA